MLERTIEQHLKKQVEALGGRCYKWCSPSNRGVPDRIVFLNGQIWFVELKSPTGYLSKLQELFGKFITQYTDNYCVLSSKDEVDKWVKSVKAD